MTSLPLELRSATGARQTLGLAFWPVDMVVVALAAIPRLFIAFTDHGMIWGDEIYQSLEPAHRVAFGYGITVWEFKEGARSWLFPWVLAAVMKLSAIFGAHTGLAVVGAVKTFMVLLGLAGVLAGMRLARRFGGETASWFAGILGATFPPALVFGSRAMGETASGTVVVLAALAIEKRAAPYAWLAGALAGGAVFLRYQNGLVLVSLLFLLLARRRFAQALRFTTAAAVAGALGGALDYLTWGRFFHSFFVYWKYNFVENVSARWGTSPWDFYFDVARSAAGPAAFAIALGLALALFRAPGLLFVAAVFVAAHCRVPHKEFRFMMPVVPLTLALSGVGLGAVLDRFDRQRLAASILGVALAVALLVRTGHVTLGEMGQFADSPEWRNLPPWNFYGGVNRAMAEAGTREDLCGLTISGIAPWWMAGFSYLHRDVPLFVADSPAPASNYLILSKAVPIPASYASVGTFHDYHLLRRDGPCAPRPPGYRNPLE
jgi:hypothetical protein